MDRVAEATLGEHASHNGNNLANLFSVVLGGVFRGCLGGWRNGVVGRNSSEGGRHNVWGPGGHFDLVWGPVRQSG